MSAECRHCGREIEPARTVHGGGYRHVHGWETCTDDDDSPLAAPSGELAGQRKDHT